MVRLLATCLGALAIFAVSAGAAQACTDSWKAPVSGDWGDGAMWSTGKSPESGDDVCITQPGTYTVTLTAYTPQEQNAVVEGGDTINSLTLGGSSGTQTLDVSGQSFDLGRGGDEHTIGLQINGNSAINAQGNLTIDATGSGSTTPYGANAFVYSGGTLSNAGTIQTQVENPIYQASLGGSVANAGTVNVSSGTLGAPAPLEGGTGSEPGFAFSNSGTWNVASGATMTMATGVGIPASSFTNAGTFGAAGTVVMQGGSSTWNQTGGQITGNPVHIQSGALLQDSAGSGAFTFDNNAAAIQGTIPAGQTVTLAGHSQYNNQLIDLNQTTLTNNGTINLTPDPNSGGTVGLTDGGVINNGTINTSVTDPQYQATLQVGLTNAHGANLNINSGTTTATGNGTVMNDGTITVAPGAQLQALHPPFTSGVETFTNAADGTIAPQIASGASFGTVSFSSYSTVNLAGTVAPTLLGGYAPAVGTEFATFPFQGSPTISGMFGAVSGGFTADYSKETASPAYIGVAYGASPASGGAGGTTGSTPTPKPAPSTLRYGKASAKGTTLRLTLSCSTGNGCPTATIRATIRERVQGHRILGIAIGKTKSTQKVKIKIVVVGARTVTLASGKHEIVTVSLNRIGRQLLARFHRLRPSVSITTGGKVRKTFTMTVVQPKPQKHSRHKHG